MLMHIRSSKKIQNEVSIEEPIGFDCEGNQITFNDILSNEDDEVLEEVSAKLILLKLRGKILSVLNGREKSIIRLRYGLDGKKEYTQKEVAEMLDISRSYVWRIEKKAIEKLRDELEGENDG